MGEPNNKWLGVKHLKSENRNQSKLLIWRNTSYEKKTKYTKIVESKIRIAAFDHLKAKIKSKGKEINYGENLKFQNYLFPNQILTFDEQQLLFAYRSRMNKLQYNYPGKKQTELCQCGVDMTNEHLYYCKVLNEGHILQDKYEQIFHGNWTKTNFRYFRT